MEKTNSATETLFHLPGWYWYLDDEKDFRELQNAENFLEVCLRVISDEFRMKGFHELFSAISKILRNANRINYEPYFKYIYNRHPFIQIIAKPLSTASVHVTIPLKREPANEIQLDILHLNQHFFNINYHIRYMIVAVDIFSRFVWMYPVIQLDVDKVANALFRAFSRPGISKNYFEKIRNEIRIITVDGGSEFKSAFPESLISIFPNSKVNVSPPKNQTYGRPTFTGPIEAAIRMIRKFLRDYGLSERANIMQKQKKKTQVGISNILFASNNMPRAVLKGESPNTVAISILNNNPKISNLLSHHMKLHRKKQLLKKVNLQTQQFPIIQTNHEDFVYRLYLPQSQFPKEVDFRVSLKTYFITDYNSMKVQIRNCENANDVQDTTWQSLVLVKHPFERVPRLAQLKKFYNKEEKQNHVQMVPLNLMEPYQISNTIRDAIGEDNAILRAHPGRVLRRTARLRRQRQEE